MLKFFATLIASLVMTHVAIAKEVYDTNLKIKCSSSIKKPLEKNAKEPLSEEISIDVKRVDWNKDASKPPNWGSISNIKIKSNGNLYEASLMLSAKQRMAFSYFEGSEKEDEASFAQI